MEAIPATLIERYRTRAPRYTSFPTAPQFRPLPDGAIEAALDESRGALSLYVHIPFCVHLCLYCGCHVEIREKKDIGDPYVDALLRELDLYRARLGPSRTLTQLALGGGTPTFLLPSQMTRLIQGIQERFVRPANADWSIEIDPRTVDEPYLETLVDLGFNRFSFGVQDFDPEVLQAVARPQTFEKVERCVSTLRARGDFNLNLDLMYGLPNQTPERFQRTVDLLLQLRPTRVALFHYAHVPWMKPAQKVLEKRGLPDSTAKVGLFALADHGLRDAGYQVIGMDHFALPGDELLSAQEQGTLQRNFMGYTTHGGLDQLGIGVSAIGAFGGIYAQNHKPRPEWSALIDQGRFPVERGFVLSDEDKLRRRIIMTLFCNFHVALTPEEQAHFAAELATLAPLVEDGLVVVLGGDVQVTALGRHFIRNVCAAFDPYLEADNTARRYSMTA